MQQEIWRNTAYPHYMVSSLGRVKATERIVKRRGRCVLSEQILKPQRIGAGYLSIGVGQQKERKRVYVHRLVADAFIPNPKNLPQINHKDGNKTNNCIENLEWVTISANQSHRYNVLNSKLGNAKAVRCIETGVVFKSCRKAGEALNIHGSGIGHCLNGKQHTSGGFHWEIIENEALK